MDVTAIIIAKNEEINIGRALKSLAFCRHVIVADDGSTDQTAAIAHQHGAKVFRLPKGETFPRKRLLAMNEASTDWVLFIDADEEITPELRDEIDRILPDNGYMAFYLRRRDFFWGHEMKYGETSRARNHGICRLFRQTSGHWVGEVHEVWMPHGKTGTLKGFINHFPHPTLSEFIADVNDYSTRRAEELKSQGVRPSLYKQLTYPFFKFILTYFFYLGFMDGPAGFVYSFLMSFHSFLVRAKLYQYVELGDKTI